MKIKINGKETSQHSLLENDRFNEGITYIGGGFVLPMIMTSVPSIVNFALISKLTAVFYLGTIIIAPAILIVSGTMICTKILVDRFLL